MSELEENPNPEEPVLGDKILTIVFGLLGIYGFLGTVGGVIDAMSETREMPPGMFLLMFFATALLFIACGVFLERGFINPPRKQNP